MAHQQPSPQELQQPLEAMQRVCQEQIKQVQQQVLLPLLGLSLA